VKRKSQVFMWKRCPKKYEYHWVLNIPEAEAIEPHFGKMFHYDAKTFFETVDVQKLMMCESSKQAYDYFITLQKTFHPVVSKWLDNFFRFEAGRWEALRQIASNPLRWWMPVATELELLAPKRDMEMHIDRIDRLSDNNLINIEYKTEKRFGLSELRHEGAFYNIGINASQKFSERCTLFGCYNPQLDRHFSEPMTVRLTNFINRLLLQFDNAVKLGDFPPRPSYFCRYCSYAQRCLDAGVFDESFVA